MKKTGMRLFARKFMVPLFWYLSVTLIVPWVNMLRQEAHTGFFEHAVWVVGVPLVISGIIHIVSRGCIWVMNSFKKI
jgi:hypothetical protein